MNYLGILTIVFIAVGLPIIIAIQKKIQEKNENEQRMQEEFDELMKKCKPPLWGHPKDWKY